MIIHTNINGIKTEGKLKNINSKNAKALERLSSGLKINRAADDSAGLAISEKMRAQVRGLNQASRNLQDGISLVQTADGALGNVQDILKRGKELCVQAANDTNTSEDRQKINDELKQLNTQIDKVGTDTEFNTLKIFTAGKTPEGNIPDDEELFRMIADVWVASALDAIHSTFSTLNTAGLGKNMTIEFAADMDVGTMASMKGGGTAAGPTEFTLKINVNYFDAALKNAYNDSGGGSIVTSYELYDKIIAHEIMHGVMYDTMWNNMAGSTATIPSWFKEGVAEAVGGGFYRIDNMTNAELQGGLGSGGLYNYSSGYAASTLLGYLAYVNNSGDTGASVNSANIAAGLDLIFAELADPTKTFDDALTNTIVMDSTDFANYFENDPAVETFLDDLRIAVGSGSGSVLVPLNTSPEATIKDTPNPYNPATSATYFIVSNSLKPVEPVEAVAASLIIHSGANSNQNITVNRFGLSADALGLPPASVFGTQTSYDKAIQSYDNAINTVSGMRSYYGAVQNRMEYSMENVDNYAENLQNAESRLRDADMSLTMMEFTKTNILSQSAMAMLAQANQMPQNILTLLR